MKDRFAILDVLDGEGKTDEFRNQIGMSHLMCGAAYTPYLHTDMGYLYEESGVAIEDDRSTASPSWDLTQGGIVVTYTGAETPSVKVTNGTAGNPVTFELDGAQLTIRDVNGKAGTDVVSAWTVFATGSDPGGFTVAGSPDATEAVPHTSNSFVDLAPPDSSAATMTLGAAESTETALYQLVKTAVSKQRVTLPPSSALAGIYAAVDRDRGVWKAPANVSVSGVIGPTKKGSPTESMGAIGSTKVSSLCWREGTCVAFELSRRPSVALSVWHDEATALHQGRSRQAEVHGQIYDAVLVRR